MLRFLFFVCLIHLCLSLYLIGEREKEKRERKSLTRDLLLRTVDAGVFNPAALPPLFIFPPSNLSRCNRRAHISPFFGTHSSPFLSPKLLLAPATSRWCAMKPRAERESREAGEERERGGSMESRRPGPPMRPLSPKKKNPSAPYHRLSPSKASRRSPKSSAVSWRIPRTGFG